tara:strand:- start:1543 stop:3723 length:2181 start_codon:yes stop_codon:yes gene_type:complete
MNPDLNELIDNYLNESLAAEEMAVLNAKLAKSKAARDEFRACCRVHGALAELFSDGGDFAFSPINTKPPIRRSWIAVVSAAAALVAILLTLKSIWPERDQMSVARITSATDAVWEAPFGDVLPNKTVSLRRGLIELEIGKGVRVAIEGPAKFEVLGPKRLRLDRGSIAADVDKAGVGFTVVTPEGEAIDFGTRFGVRVDAGGQSETHVFEGEVEIVARGKKLRLHDDEASKFQQLLTLGAEPWTFPMPAHELPVDLGTSFEPGQQIGAGMPTEPAIWSGDGARIISRSADGSIHPVRGASMLQFLATYSPEQTEAGDQRASEVWRIVDLRPFSDRVNTGEVTVKLGSFFNRLSGVGNSQFRLGIGAYRGRIEEAKAFWDRKNELTSERLAATSSVILSDDDPETWEPLEVSMPVPPGTDFLLIDLLAFENETDRDENEFEGHFADDVRLRLTSRARKSVATAVWAGRSGSWDAEANWVGGKPDPALDQIVIDGEGEARIDRRFATKQSVVIANHNDSTGRLRIGPSGELVKSGFGQLIVGFNPGARAELIVQGKLVTRSPVFIGRNNAESLVDLDGGVWDGGDGTIRMAQYGEKFPDTVSRLRVREGGSLTARSLELVHDLATLEIDNGEIEVEMLLLGGGDGEAVVQLRAGKLRVRRLIFGAGSGSFDFRSPRGVLWLEGSWTAESVLAMPNAEWRVDGRPAAADDFEIEHDGAFSKIRVRANSH